MNATAQEIIDFWIDEVGPKGWFAVDEAVDREIRDRWLGLWEKAQAGGLGDWRTTIEGCFALLILLDQFPRNMFRGSPKAFASDARALAIAKVAILHGRDQLIPLPQRQFFYTPLMHSETLTNQDQSVRLYLMNFGHGSPYLQHALAHREIIRSFGRFPYRNAALGRESTPEETAFIEEGGYQGLMQRYAA
jgi:uncharacterized protein (DUF924 family)